MGQTFFRMEKTLLGIEIGNTNIKIVQGTKKGKNISLSNYKIIPTPKDSVRDGFIVDINSIKKSIEEFIITKKLLKQNTAIIVQGTGIITRDVLMPALPEKELKTVLEYQKDEYFPIDVSDYQTDFKILDEVETEEGKRLNVLLVAAPNSIINSSIDLVQKLNLKPKFIDIIPNCISRVFKTKSMISQEEEPNSIMILDLGGQTTTATILSEGNILFSRSILYGLDYINSLIEEELGVKDIVKIEEFKRKISLDYDYKEDSMTDDLYQNNINDSVREDIENNIIQEIMRFLEFYNSRKNAKKINKIYLIGGGAYLKNIDKYIQRILNIDTSIANYSDLDGIDIENSVDFKKDFLYLVNALGLISRM
ncbi:type IV pilus assembly protein PilM [Defluviitalea phaphyphila]|uniref:type IV pilus assembly protein PilM n=1 Tax=Defluviitalea phaphyphila TaxID=1473580 RepID=UPI0007312C58|nr:type IV pilus assembly protein PilM [Defluviitalea phaphyphila]